MFPNHHHPSGRSREDRRSGSDRLGIKREAKALGYAVSSVNNDALTAGNEQNVMSAISGKVAGVDISLPQQQGLRNHLIAPEYSPKRPKVGP